MRLPRVPMRLRLGRSGRNGRSSRYCHGTPSPLQRRPITRLDVERTAGFAHSAYPEFAFVATASREGFMNADRFDGLSRDYATGSITRRATLKGLALGSLVPLFGGRFADEAEAAKCKPGKCAKKNWCENRTHTCGPAGGFGKCFVKRFGGKNICAEILFQTELMRRLQRAQLHRLHLHPGGRRRRQVQQRGCRHGLRLRAKDLARAIARRPFVRARGRSARHSSPPPCGRLRGGGNREARRPARVQGRRCRIRRPGSPGRSPRHDPSRQRAGDRRAAPAGGNGDGGGICRLRIACSLQHRHHGEHGPRQGSRVPLLRPAPFEAGRPANACPQSRPRGRGGLCRVRRSGRSAGNLGGGRAARGRHLGSVGWWLGARARARVRRRGAPVATAAKRPSAAQGGDARGGAHGARDSDPRRTGAGGDGAPGRFGGTRVRAPKHRWRRHLARLSAVGRPARAPGLHLAPMRTLRGPDAEGRSLATRARRASQRRSPRRRRSGRESGEAAGTRPQKRADPGRK